MAKIYKVALDCGHGLNTAGKQTPDGIKEWTLNDSVRDNVVAMLNGYNVEFIFPDNNEGKIDESLTSRRTMYVNANVDAAVSIHHNANTGSWNSATGVEVYVDKNATNVDKALASAIYNRMVKNIGLKGRGIKSANWTVINQNKVPAILTEGGFMDSTIDHKVITSSKGQEAYARAIADGLIEFLGLTRYNSESASTPTPSSNSTYKMATLKKGVNNNDVTIFESIMKKMGYYTGNIDTSYGQKCVDACNRFQSDYPECGTNGNPDGIFGTKCWSKALSLIKA